VRHLILLRHAKSESAHDGLADFDRPLSKRGERQLTEVAAAITPFISGLCHCVCSSALRTRQTLALALPSWPEIQVSYSDPLYAAGYEKIADIVLSCPPEIDTIILVGHNPGISAFLNLALHPDEGEYYMPTSCAAVIRYPKDIKTAINNQGRLAAFLTPKNLA